MSDRKRTVGVRYDGYSSQVTLGDIRLMLSRAQQLGFTDTAILKVVHKSGDSSERVIQATFIDDEPEEEKT